MTKMDSHSNDPQNSEIAFGRNMAQQKAFEIYRIFATDMTERGLLQLVLIKNGKPNSSVLTTALSSQLRIYRTG